MTTSEAAMNDPNPFVATLARYRLSATDVDLITARNRKVPHLGVPPRLSTALPIDDGDVIPMIVVTSHTEQVVGGWAILPADDPYWIHFATRGDAPGEWQPVETAVAA